MNAKEKEIVGVVSWENIKAKEALREIQCKRCGYCPFNVEDMDDFKCCECDENDDIVESALNRLEELEQENKHLKNQIKVYKRNHEQDLAYICELKKVLKIIKEKVNKQALLHLFAIELKNKEQFDLLKEYLK